MKITDAVALIACGVAILTGLWLGQDRTVANYGSERDFYDTWAPRAESPFDVELYARGVNELGYPLARNHPPGYPWLVAAGNLATGDSFRTAVIFSAVAAGLFGWVSYLLLSALFDREKALAATLLLLVACVPYSFLASTDLVGGLAVTLPLWILFRRRNASPSVLLLAGLLAGIAYLIRSQAIFLVPGLLVAVPLVKRYGLGAGPDARDGAESRVFRDAMLVLAGFLLTAGPWLLFNWKLNGSPLYSTTHLQVGAHFWDPLGQTNLTAYWRASGRFDSLGEVVLHDPAGFARRFLKQITLRMPESLGVEVLGYPGFFLFGGGAVFLLASLNLRRFAWLAALLFGYLLLGLVDIHVRYFIFLYPAVFFTVALVAFVPPVLAMFRRLRLPRPAIGSWALVACIALLMVRDVRMMTRRYLEAEPRFLLELVETMRERAAPGDRVMVHEPHVPYLSGLEMALVEGENVESILRNGRRQGVRFYVYDAMEAREWPGREGLADPAAVPPDLKAIYVHGPTGTILYELLPEAP